ncbi:MAG: hypothetical protein KatS3mg001_342 [Candidatus Pacearchaeota archaeon]|nr:MAG: hypothetical protein KatS3mg001_342 [Candidatus Pacearchaeota archaeon]
MDPIREAFQKIKRDINSLFNEISSLKKEVFLLKKAIEENINKKSEESADAHKNTTPSQVNSAHQHVFKALKGQNLTISTGNQGVPTDRQTDRQTDTHPEKSINLKEISSILDSLDSLKKELRIKFKRLTNQEFLVFSTIYTLEEERGYADYKSIAKILNLTPSSIRDYTSKIINKGIPIKKIRINNKLIHLKISEDLKKITTLSTISKLREL